MIPTRKLTTALIAGALALSFGACGDDEEEPAASDAPAVTAEAPAETTEDTTSDDASGGGTEVPDDQQELLDTAIEQCKQQAAAVPNIEDDLRAEIEDLCETAGSGDLEDAQEAGREVCRKIVEASLPEGDAREQGLAACDGVT